ncbi:MAG: hypothetical protein FJ126_05205 [Deltaproteobacteria bacterium]|nr:hypothetical protein [Deltaproteobacteria bacterium]
MEADLRQFEVQARSTETFGRVLCRARNHHFVVDGPVQNGCPGEAVTPGELFLSGIAACGVELMQVIAKEQQLALKSAKVAITGVIDRRHPVRPDLNLFNAVRLQFHLQGVSDEQGARLLAAFKGR